jgi:hypothetical protein
MTMARFMEPKYWFRDLWKFVVWPQTDTVQCSLILRCPSCLLLGVPYDLFHRDSPTKILNGFLISRHACYMFRTSRCAWVTHSDDNTLKSTKLTLCYQTLSSDGDNGCLTDRSRSGRVLLQRLLIHAAQRIAEHTKQHCVWSTPGWATASKHQFPLVFWCTLWSIKGPYWQHFPVLCPTDLDQALTPILPAVGALNQCPPGLDQAQTPILPAVGALNQCPIVTRILLTSIVKMDIVRSSETSTIHTV